MILRRACLSPLLLTCEHGSRRLPAGIRVNAAERRILASHHGLDIGAWEMTRELSSRLAATALCGRFSRLWIDLNRDEGDLSLIRLEADGVELGWNRGLTGQERADRIKTIHRRYHQAIDLQIRRLLDRGVRPMLLSVHSFTDRWNGRSRDFDCGVLYDRHGRHARTLAAGLRKEKLAVKYNAPYSGKLGMMYSIQRHGAAHSLPCLELELNQDRIDSRKKVAAWAPAITRAVKGLLEI